MIFHFRNPSNPNWQSVADRISELEKHHINQAYETNQKYTYLDPSKTTKVPNPTLKAFQKNAVQSYFERQQSSTKEMSTNQTAGRPQSLPVNNTTTTSQKPVDKQTRSSLPTNFLHSNNISISPKSQQSTNAASVFTSSPTSLSIQSNKTNTMSQSNSINTAVLQTSASPTSKQLPSPLYQATFQHHSAVTYNIPITTSASVTGKQFNNHLNNINNITDNMNNYHSNNSSNGKYHNLNISRKIIMVNEGCLEAANESGVPPPPPRRGKLLLPVRRYTCKVVVQTNNNLIAF